MGVRQPEPPPAAAAPEAAACCGCLPLRGRGRDPGAQPLLADGAGLRARLRRRWFRAEPPDTPLDVDVALAALLTGKGSDGASALEAVAVTPARFVQLAIFAAACFLSAINWNIFAPVYDIGMERFGVGEQRINSLANCWNVYTSPGALLAVWLVERSSLRASLLWGYGSQLLCAAGSYAACVAPGLSRRTAFGLLYAAQALGAAGQPLYLNNVTLLVGAWFPARERDAAVALSLMMVAAGGVFVSLFAPAAVTAPAQVGRLFCWQVPAWLLLTAAAAALTSSEPPAPPSAAAAVLRAQRAAARTADGGAALRVAATQVGTLAGNANFAALNLSSSLLTGLVYTLYTVVGELLAPCGGSDALSGGALAVAAGASALAVLFYLFVLRRDSAEPDEDGDGDGGGLGAASGGAPRSTASSRRSSQHALVAETAPHPYAAHQLGWSAAACVGIALVLATLAPATPAAATLAAWAGLGLLTGTLMNGALTFEHAAELSFPLPPNVSVALLSVTGAVASAAQVVAGSAVLARGGGDGCATPATPFAAFCAANAAVGLGLLAALRPEYRRAAVEARVAAADAAAAAEEAASAAESASGRSEPRTRRRGGATSGSGSGAYGALS